jgi:serine phosphatase RsbU (regulator of sigma subunit)/putative methionine-R-sulfoxide reductase with GAF domain/anti-sigma regulatory factor (Ser/Thr protein kinase)
LPTQTFPARFESLNAIREFVATAARSAGLDEKEVYNVQLAADEAASNITEHAYQGVADGQIEISAQVVDDELQIVLRDQGKPFDPDEIDEPNVDATLEERAVGGLGLLFMRKLMDELRFAYAPESGNTLTMIKRLPAGKTRRSKWRELLFGLGDHMLAATNFAVQRDLLIETVSRLIAEGETDLWLNEPYFRLPDWVESIFPSEPPTGLMRQAHETGKVAREINGETFSLAIPLRRAQTGLGVVEVRRLNGKKFSRREQDLLAGLAQIASIALFAWHLEVLDRWRLGQLGLVRTVSAQIANEPDLDELARRVTRLIRSTFKYYYVAIFTLERSQTVLTFRSSAGGAENPKRPLGFIVELGQGLVGNAAAGGELILVNDVRAEPRFRYVDSLPETLSEVSIPLKVEERVVGVLDLQSEELNAFHPRDLLVLRALADNIAIAVEGAQLYNDLLHQADRLKVVSEVSKQITSILNLRELMEKVANMIHERFGYPHVHLFSVHPNRRQIHYEAGSGARSVALEGYMLALDDPDGIVPWVARHGLAVLANDVEKEPRYRPSLLPPANTRSELTTPLVFDGQVYGVLDVQSDQLNAFTDQDMLLFETLSDAVAGAIRNADLYRSEQWRRQVGDSLREVAVLLSANASLEQVLEAILTELERNLPSDISAIWLLDEGEIYCAAVHGAKAADLERTRRNVHEAADCLAAGLMGHQPSIRKPDERMGPAAFSAGLERDHSGISVPLRIGGQSVGVLTLSHHAAGRYGHEAQDMATTFASYAAVAIENARLYDDAQEQAYSSAALLQVAQAVVSLSDLDEILGTIVRTMPILVGVQRAAVYSWDAAARLFHPRQAYGIAADQRESVWRALSGDEFPLLAAAVERGQSVLCQAANINPENWRSVEPCSDDDLEAVTYSDDRLLAALPLMVKGDVFGVLLVEETSGGRRFRSRRLEILNGVAQQIALAMQNDLFQKASVVRERLEMEAQLARQIQQAFVPETLPTPPGWDLSARWRTARQVGGDFYDIIELSDERLGLFIADVADKGMPAALFMALTRTLMRAAVLQTDSPAEALRQVNDLLYPDCEQGMFVTAVYGVLDLKTGRFTYANAGHNPPLSLTPAPLPLGEGQVTRLTRTGIALGVIEHAEMGERSIDLLPGQTLVLYTDGITEAFSPTGEIYGEERLLRLLGASPAPSAGELLDEIDASVSAFIADAPVSDDITMLAVRRGKNF